MCISRIFQPNLVHNVIFCYWNICDMMWNFNFVFTVKAHSKLNWQGCPYSISPQFLHTSATYSYHHLITMSLNQNWRLMIAELPGYSVAYKYFVFFYLYHSLCIVYFFFAQKMKQNCNSQHLYIQSTV